MTSNQPEGPVDFYQMCLDYVVEQYGKDRVDYFRHLNLSDITLQDFFREYAWVALASGFQWSTIDSLRYDLSAAFKKWNLQEIAADPDGIVDDALDVFGHEGKINSIVDTACLLAEWDDGTFAEFKRGLASVESMDSPWLARLRRFGYIGPTTQFHLARNIGLDFAKPDRWLKRAAGFCGYDETPRGVRDFVDYICNGTGERPGVVDYVIWRYLADCG